MNRSLLAKSLWQSGALTALFLGFAMVGLLKAFGVMTLRADTRTLDDVVGGSHGSTFCQPKDSPPTHQSG